MAKELPFCLSFLAPLFIETSEAEKVSSTHFIIALVVSAVVFLIAIGASYYAIRKHLESKERKKRPSRDDGAWDNKMTCRKTVGKPPSLSQTLYLAGKMCWTNAATIDSPLVSLTFSPLV